MFYKEAPKRVVAPLGAGWLGKPMGQEWVGSSWTTQEQVTKSGLYPTGMGSLEVLKQITLIFFKQVCLG